jgi:hypothetical protein
MKNDFILHLKHRNIGEEDKLLQDLISRHEFHASLVFTKTFKDRNEAIYRIKISPSSLVKLKKMLDEKSTYESLELFEYRVW